VVAGGGVFLREARGGVAGGGRGGGGRGWGWWCARLGEAGGPAGRGGEGAVCVAGVCRRVGVGVGVD